MDEQTNQNDQWQGFIEESEKPPAQQEKNFKTLCGGQALIEGIMMRGPTKQAVVIRKPDGELEIQEKELKLVKERWKVLGLPFIRGPVNFFDAMLNGMKALLYSAEFFPEDEEIPLSKFEIWLEKKLGAKGLTTAVTFLAVGLSIAMTIGLFIFLPTLLGSGVTFFTDSQVVRNVAESVIKMVIFLAYLALCSQMKDIRRNFMYHGAEHKTIFCYEAGLPLTLENVRAQPRFHPRCGTSFLLFVILISILISTIVFSIYPVDHVLWRMLANLGMLPFVVAISYECNRFLGRHDGKICRLLIAPGLWLQRLTTFEPEDDMIEVGIRALELVVPETQGADRW